MISKVIRIEEIASYSVITAYCLGNCWMISPDSSVTTVCQCEFCLHVREDGILGIEEAVEADGN